MSRLSRCAAGRHRHRAPVCSEVCLLLRSLLVAPNFACCSEVCLLLRPGGEPLGPAPSRGRGCGCGPLFCVWAGCLGGGSRGQGPRGSGRTGGEVKCTFRGKMCILNESGANLENWIFRSSLLRFYPDKEDGRILSVNMVVKQRRCSNNLLPFRHSNVARRTMADYLADLDPQSS